jgi:glycine cleavage system aminomethyltransferase T
MKNPNYATAHGTLRISAKRFEPSPYTDKYATDDMIYGIYCQRFYPLSVGEDPIEQYWKLRRGVMLFDVPEKPLDIKGPDAVALLERVFTRRIDNLKFWRARYAIACTPRGGIVMDGVLIRLAADHFWYVQADGEFESWLHAHAQGLDVTISDPKSRVIQIQGPKSLEVLQAAAKDGVPDGFGYFHADKFDFGGQELLVTRTGWTGEIGIEIYSDGASTDHHALWDHLMAAGESFGIEFSGAESMGIRRIEAGILDNGTDIDPSMTPYEAGIGAFVDLDKPDFVGRDALMKADQSCLLMGLTCTEAVPFAGLQVLDGDSVVGHMTTGAWTPYLETGVGFVRFDEKGDWLGRKLTLCTAEGDHHVCEIVSLPFYDAEKKIPRGLE